MKWIFVLLFLIVSFLSLVLWYLQDFGHIAITWLGYEVQLSLFIGVLVLLLFASLLVLLIRGLRCIFKIPSKIFSTFQESRELKAQHELLEFLSAYEAENFTEALHYQKKLADKVSEDPFFLWISGKVFEKVEKFFEAEICFINIIKNPYAAFLGFKGQIRAALHRHDITLANDLLLRTKKLMPTSPWVLKHLLALAREMKNFQEAEALVLTLEDLGYLSSDQSKKQIAHLQYLQAIQPGTPLDEKEGLLRQAHALDPSLLEATEALVTLLEKQGFITYALDILEKACASSPHQKLGDLYLRLSSPSDNVHAYQIALELGKNNPMHPENLLFLARAALKAKLWNEARTHLLERMNQKTTPTAEVYELFAKVELEEHQNWKDAIKWLEQGLHAPRHI